MHRAHSILHTALAPSVFTHLTENTAYSSGQKQDQKPKDLLHCYIRDKEVLDCHLLGHVQEAHNTKLKSSPFADTLVGCSVSDLAQMALKHPPGDAAHPPSSRASPTWMQQSEAEGLSRVLLLSRYF